MTIVTFTSTIGVVGSRMVVCWEDYWPADGRVGKASGGRHRGRYVLLVKELAIREWWTMYLGGPDVTAEEYDNYLNGDSLVTEILTDSSVEWSSPEEDAMARRLWFGPGGSGEKRRKNSTGS